MDTAKGNYPNTPATSFRDWLDFDRCFTCRSNVLLVVAFSSLIVALALMAGWCVYERLHPSYIRRDQDEEFMIDYKHKFDRELEMMDVVLPLKLKRIDDD